MILIISSLFFCFSRFFLVFLRQQQQTDSPNSHRSGSSKSVFQCDCESRRQPNGNSWRCWCECDIDSSWYCTDERLCTHYRSRIRCTIRYRIWQTPHRSNAKVSISRAGEHIVVTGINKKLDLWWFNLGTIVSWLAFLGNEINNLYDSDSHILRYRQL